MQRTWFLVQVLLIRCSLGVTRLTATPTDTFFFSPSYPRQYGDNLEESWLLTARDPSHVIHLEVVDSQIEASATCLYDYVQVHDGATTDSPVIGKFCGSSTPAYVTTGRHMYVFFKSDASGTNIGFYIKYYSAPSSVTSTQTSSLQTTEVTTSGSSSTSIIDTEQNTTDFSMTTEPETSSADPGTNQFNVGQSSMSSTTIIGILIAVAFLLTVFLVIMIVICIHKANKAPVGPRPRPNEEEIWSKINSTPKSRKPIRAQDSEQCSRTFSATSGKLTSGFSSGAISSPSTVDVECDYIHNTLSPVAATKQFRNYIMYLDGHIDSDTKQVITASPRRSPRRLSPLSTPHGAPRVSESSQSKVTFVDETADNYTQSLRVSTERFGLAAALVKARANHKGRNQVHPKGGNEFERGHKHSKATITRIDMLGYGATSLGHWSTGVPKVEDRRRRHSAYEVKVTDDSERN